MLAFFYGIDFFILCNFLFVCPCQRLFGRPAFLLEKPKARLSFYLIALCTYLGLFCAVAHFLRKNDYDSFIVLLAGLLTGVVYLIYGIVYWCNKFMLYLSLNCCCNSKEDSHYTISYIP